MKTTNYQSPQHGAVIQITKAEAEKLAKHWGTKIEFKTAEELTNPLCREVHMSVVKHCGRSGCLVFATHPQQMHR